MGVEHKKQSFIQGAMILMVAGVLNRILGFIPRIVLPRIIGAEGVGLYQLGYPLLILILTIITGGIPLAVAKMVAAAESQGREDKVKSILKIALTLAISLSILFTGISLIASSWITRYLLTDHRVYYTFLCMTPMIPLVAVSSVLRGYFEGRQNMIPTASSQVAETITRIVVVIILAYFLLPYGIGIAAAGAMLGVTIGEFSGMLVLLSQYRMYKRYRATTTKPKKIARPKNDKTEPTLFRRLLQIALPVTGSKLVGSASYFVESIIIVQSLAIAGVLTHIATAQYGALQGMVIPILLLPNALTYSLSVSLIPSLSEAAARKDMKTIHKRLHQSLRLALVSGAPFVVIMYVLSGPLCFYLFHNEEVDTMLRMMAPVALFIYFQGPLQATLQALDHPGKALRNTFIGSLIKLTLIYLLATQPKLGIMGAIFAININILIVTFLHWNSVVRLLHFSTKFIDFVKVGFGMAVMGSVCWTVMNYPWIENTFVRFISACFLGILIYLLCIIGLKMIDRHDLQRIPWIGPLLVNKFQ